MSQEDLMIRSTKARDRVYDAIALLETTMKTLRELVDYGLVPELRQREEQIQKLRKEGRM